MSKHSNISFAAVFALAFSLLAACTASEFGAGGSKGKSANLRADGDGGSDLNDGADNGGDSDSGGSDSGGKDGADAGGTDTYGGTDGADTGGSDTGGTESGGTDSANDSGDGVDGIGSGSDSGQITPGELATSDDVTKKKYLSDGTVHRSSEDAEFVLKVETLIKGTVVQTNTFTFEDDGQAKEGETLKLACRSAKDTCLRLTFVGEITQVLGGSACTKVLNSTTNSADIHADTNGAGMLGSCLPSGNTSDDDSITVTCPTTKALKVENCNG